MDERSVRIRILNLDCASEAPGLERRLLRVAGVLAVDVNPVVETAYLRFDGHVTSAQRLRAAIEGAGFRTDEPIAS